MNKPIPEDLVTILAKDEEKQKQIREKSTKDAESAQARSIGPSTLTTSNSPSLNPSATSARIAGAPAAKIPTSGSPQPSGASSKAMVKTSSSSSPQPKDASASGKRINMVIQAIPPFKGKRPSVTPSGSTASSTMNGAQASVPPIRTSSTNTTSNSSSTPLSPSAVNRLNVNASSFRPTPKVCAQSHLPAPYILFSISKLLKETVLEVARPRLSHQILALLHKAHPTPSSVPVH